MNWQKRYKEDVLIFTYQQFLSELRKAGAVGDIGFHFFNKSRKPVHHPLYEKVVDLSLEQLKKFLL